MQDGRGQPKEVDLKHNIDLLFDCHTFSRYVDSIGTFHRRAVSLKENRNILSINRPAQVLESHFKTIKVQDKRCYLKTVHVNIQ